MVTRHLLPVDTLQLRAQAYQYTMGNIISALRVQPYQYTMGNIIPP
jgi:hypothetical protein